MDANALIIWRDEDDRLRLAVCSSPTESAEAWDFGAADQGPAQVFDVTAEEAAERVLCLAQPGRPRVGDKVSWKHGKGRRRGRVYFIFDTLGEAGIRMESGALCGLSFDRLTIEEG